MKFTVVGTSHHFCPLEIRERLSLFRNRRDSVSRMLRAMSGVRSFFILSTCNRSEIYLWADEAIDGFQVFCDLHGVNKAVFDAFLYVHQGEKAWQHFMRVACGLDSHIIGESQIFGQIQNAIVDVRDSGGLKAEALRSIDKAMCVVEGIRKDVGPGGSFGTLADAALTVIRKNQPEFNQKKFLLIGTGKIIGLFLPLLDQEGITPVIVSNRNYEIAVEWARRTGGTPARLGDLAELVSTTDIIISATSCPHAVLRCEHFIDIKKRVLILDLAVPRDAEPGVKDISGVRLFDLDDIGFSILEGQQQEWVNLAERKVLDESLKLWNEFSGLEHEKVLSH